MNQTELSTNTIVSLVTSDIHFPTFESLHGSDAINKDQDYSAAYITISTRKGDQGHGLIFTVGRGNDICCKTIEALEHLVIGDITNAN